MDKCSQGSLAYTHWYSFLYARILKEFQNIDKELHCQGAVGGQRSGGHQVIKQYTDAYNGKAPRVSVQSGIASSRCELHGKDVWKDLADNVCWPLMEVQASV